MKSPALAWTDMHVTADSRTWRGFLAKEKSLALALLSRKIRMKGNPKLLLAFGKCFPTVGPRRKKVEILPQPSKIKHEPSQYLKNDPGHF